jgi:hypothetical protein
MPEQPGPLAALQAKVDAMTSRIPRDVLRITVLGRDERTNRLKLDVHTTQPEFAEQVIKMLTIKLHTGRDDEPSLLSVSTEVEPQPEKPGLKLWTAGERTRRSKPKSDIPDFD